VLSRSAGIPGPQCASVLRTDALLFAIKTNIKFEMTRLSVFAFAQRTGGPQMPALRLFDYYF
jgi:hypothetical protein